MKTLNHEKSLRFVNIIIFILGTMGLFIAGGLALGFPPIWESNTSMESHLNPNSDFLTNRPKELNEPVDSSILTAPAWLYNFLTPGAIFFTRTPSILDVTPTISSGTPASAPTNTLTP